MFAGCTRERVEKKSQDSYEIRVMEKPIAGMANRRVSKIIALVFRVPEGKVRLIKGARQPNKIFEIREDL